MLSDCRRSPLQNGQLFKKGQEDNTRLRSFSVGTAKGPMYVGNQFDIRAEQCPNASVAGTVVENHVHYRSRRHSTDNQEQVPNSPKNDTEGRRNLPSECFNNIIVNIKNEETDSQAKIHARERLLASLAAYYDRDDAWLALPWDKKVRFSPEDIYVGLRVQTLDKAGKFEMGDPKKIKNFFDPLPGSKAPARKILVRGEPSFGKTIMCNKIARDWSRRSKTFSGFPDNLTMVLYLKLKYLTRDAVLEDELMKLVLQKDTFNRNDNDYKTFIDILETSGRYVVILLDGYEEASVQLKQQVRELLKSKPDCIFKGASMVITSRPEVDLDLLTLVHGHFILKELSEKSSIKLIKRYFRASDKYCVNFYHKAVKHLQLQHLSPLLLLMICYCGNGGSSPAPEPSIKTSELYHRLIIFIVKQNCKSFRLSDQDINCNLLKLGEFFWMCLERNHTVFSLDELAHYLRNHTKFVLKSGLVKPFRLRILEPVHSILMETLAAAYLEQSCLLHSSKGEMSQFLRYNFLTVSCLNMYYYTDREGKVTFRFDFDYNTFRFSYKILESGEETCKMLINCLQESWQVDEHCLSLTFKAPLTDQNKSEVLEFLPQLFPNHPVPSILSEFISCSVFNNISLKFTVDCETGVNVHFMRLKECCSENLVATYESSPLVSIRSISEEVVLTFQKPYCNPETISSVLKRLGINGGTYRVEDALAFLKDLRDGSCTPTFVVARVYSGTAYAQILKTTVNVKNHACTISRILWSPDFSWQNCQQIEIFFRKSEPENFSTNCELSKPFS